MKRTLGMAVLLTVLLSGRPTLSSAGPPPTQATCVFTNPAYSGKCVENASVADGSTPQQACQAILSCLNNVDCLKTYCSATTIRTGWKLESAK
jgi:hypothetical protein